MQLLSKTFSNGISQDNVGSSLVPFRNNPSSNHHRDKFAPVIRLFGENSKQVQNLLSSDGGSDQVYIEQSAMVKCPHFARNWIGMDANNIGNLLCFKFLAREPVFSSKLLGWHLVLTLPLEKEGKAFSKFVFSRKVYQCFDEVLQVLSYIFDDQQERTFHRAFRNIIKHFETRVRSILSFPASVILDMLSTAMLEFSRVLRDPSLNGISREELFKEFDRRVAIDESEFFIDAIMQAQQVQVSASKKPNSAIKPIQPLRPYVQEIRNVPRVPSSGVTSASQSFVAATRCFAKLAFDLKVSRSSCNNRACRFSHESLPVPIPVIAKRELLNSFSSIKSEEFKKLITDAVNLLQSV